MSESKFRSSDLVSTEAELPPGIDVPPPPTQAGTISEDVRREVRRLAERVGGMKRLRELVGAMAMGDR